MKRLLSWLLLLGLVPTLSSADILSPRYEEGIAYRTIVPQQPTSTEEGIEVLELFWYGCPHCHRFQPALERWLKRQGDKVTYKRMPAILAPHWEIHARVFYTAEVLGVLEQIHQPLFRAIHNHKRRLDSEASLMAFFAEHGVDNETFRNTFHSFAVDAKVRRAREMTRRYAVSGTPSMVVNGKYRTDGVMMPKGFDMLKVVEFLVEEERKTVNKGKQG